MSSHARDPGTKSQGYQTSSGLNNFRNSQSSDPINSQNKAKKSIKSNKNYWLGSLFD